MLLLPLHFFLFNPLQIEEKKIQRNNENCLLENSTFLALYSNIAMLLQHIVFFPFSSYLPSISSTIFPQCLRFSTAPPFPHHYIPSVCVRCSILGLKRRMNFRRKKSASYMNGFSFAFHICFTAHYYCNRITTVLLHIFDLLWSALSFHPPLLFSFRRGLLPGMEGSFCVRSIQFIHPFSLSFSSLPLSRSLHFDLCSIAIVIVFTHCVCVAATMLNIVWNGFIFRQSFFSLAFLHLLPKLSSFLAFSDQKTMKTSYQTKQRKNRITESKWNNSSCICVCV